MRFLLVAILSAATMRAWAKDSAGREILEAGRVKIQVRIERGWKVQGRGGGPRSLSDPIRMEFTPTRGLLHGGVLPFDAAQISLSWWSGADVDKLRRDDALGDENEPLTLDRVRCHTGRPEQIAIEIHKWRPGPTASTYVDSIAYVAVPGGIVKVKFLRWEESRLPDHVQRCFQEVVCTASASAVAQAGQ